MRLGASHTSISRTLTWAYTLELAVRDCDCIERCSLWDYTVNIRPVLAPAIEGR